MNNYLYKLTSILLLCLAHLSFPLESTSSDSRSHSIELTTTKVKRACTNNDVKMGGGCSVSYIFYDQDGDFAIFKPQGEDSWGPGVKWFGGRWRRECLQNVKTFQPFLNHIGGDFCCEIASEKVAEIVQQSAGLPDDLVSPTSVISLKLPGQKQSKKGSFQIFEKGVVSGKEYLGINLDYSIAASSPQYKARQEAFSQSFQWLVIFDVITGHMDRHSNNFMVREKNGSLLAIDGGMSFSPWHPDPSENSPTRASASEEMSKLYYWANPKAQFELAQRSFTSESKRAIQRIYERRGSLCALVENVYKKESGSLATERAETMLNRIELLYICSQHPDFMIKDFWNYRTKQQVERALNVHIPYPRALENSEKESFSLNTIQAILHIPSLLADNYGLTGESCEPIERRLDVITTSIAQKSNVDETIKRELKKIENEAFKLQNSS